MLRMDAYRVRGKALPGTIVRAGRMQRVASGAVSMTPGRVALEVCKQLIESNAGPLVPHVN